MAWPDPGNDQRREIASDRDREVGQRLLETAHMTDRETALVEARVAGQGKSWQQIADQLGISKHAATGMWRRVLRRANKERATS